MTYLSIFITLLLLPFSVVAQGEARDLEQVKADIQRNLPGIVINNVEETPIAGLYQVTTSASISYMSADGRYLLNNAELIDQKEGTNLTQLLMGDIRVDRLNKLGDKNMLVYKAKQEKHVLTVFTDTSCGFCQRLHQDIPQLNQEGITVRYLLFPRSGPNSHAGQTMQSVWCSKDPLQAMTDAKMNKRISPLQCENPILEHLRIGQEFGLRGTPMMITEAGEVLPGYMKPAHLKNRIGLR